MGDDTSRPVADVYKETICLVQCDILLQEDRTILRDEYFAFCSFHQVLPVLDFNKKQLHLYGLSQATIEAEKRFLQIQNELLIESNTKHKLEGIHWWYEAWDGTWQLYNMYMTEKIEAKHKAHIPNFSVVNEFDETVAFDLRKLEEIYGQRTKRIRRSKIDEQQPQYWTLTPNAIIEFSEQFPLQVESNEYFVVKSNFDRTMNNNYKTILSIERIQNLRLFKQFTVQHEHFIAKYGKETNGMLSLLFHGCPEAASKKIIERGFNRSYSGLHGCFYGRGVYFSSNASYSDKYATANEHMTKRMFLSRVLIGKSMIGNSSLCEPADGFDTTTDGTHIYVCYYDSQCYPEYLMTYN